MRENREHFYAHGPTHGSVMYGREFAIKFLKESLKGLPEWSRERIGFPFLRPEEKWVDIHGDIPIISVKTRQGVSFGTQLLKGKDPQEKLPYWGTVNDVRTNMVL
jgi:hypothetical protein